MKSPRPATTAYDNKDIQYDLSIGTSLRVKSQIMKPFKTNPINRNGKTTNKIGVGSAYSIMCVCLCVIHPSVLNTTRRIEQQIE